MKQRLSGGAPAASLPEGAAVEAVQVKEVDLELEQLKRSIDQL
jgi:hypothetical protein